MVSVEGGGVTAALRHAWRRARPFLSIFFGETSPFAVGVVFPALVAAAGIAGLFVLAIANDQSQAANQIALLALCSGSAFVNVTYCSGLLSNKDALVGALGESLFDTTPGRPASLVPTGFGRTQAQTGQTIGIVLATFIAFCIGGVPVVQRSYWRFKTLLTGGSDTDSMSS